MIQKIAKEIESLSGKYSGYEIFSDWIKTLAISISNSSDLIHGKVWQERERQYMEIVQRQGQENIRHFCKMSAMLAETLEDPQDVLGAVYMAAGLGSKQTGQFFTPFHLSILDAQLAVPEDVSPEKPILINEPSTGGGGMIIAVVKTLLERGINPQKCMDVVAQDLDWKGVYMTYIQLSLLGIKATVVQGDTLCEPFVNEKTYPPERVLYTPARKGLLM
jgi:hypothetical protein